MNKLDSAWGRINALGGTAGEYDDFGKGCNYAVGQALDIIEELGGRDPLLQNGPAALVGVQRPEDVARAPLIEFIARQRKKLDEISTPAPGTWSKGYREALDSFERVVLALPHTGQPQEGNERLRIREMRVTVSAIFQLARDAQPNAKTLKAIREAAERALTRDASKAAPVPAPQAGCAKEGWRGPMITQIIREVAELPDRTSPEDRPEMMLVSCDELEGILENLVPSEHDLSPPPPVAESGWQPGDRVAVKQALAPFAAFAERAEAFVEARAKDGGAPILPSTDFRLADFRRAKIVFGQLFPALPIVAEERPGMKP